MINTDTDPDTRYLERKPLVALRSFSKAGSGEVAESSFCAFMDPATALRFAQDDKQKLMESA